MAKYSAKPTNIRQTAHWPDSGQFSTVKPSSSSMVHGLHTLNGGDEFAGSQAKEPFATVQALDQGWGDADDAHRDPRHCQIHNVQVLWGPVGLLACSRFFH